MKVINPHTAARILFVVLCFVRIYRGILYRIPDTHGHRAFSRRTAADCLHWNLTIAGYSADRAFATEVSLSPLSVIAHHREQSCNQVLDSSACRLIPSATTGMYLLKEYAVVNDRVRMSCPLSRLYTVRCKHFYNLFFKNNFNFF